MNKRVQSVQSRRHIWIRDEDWNYLSGLYDQPGRMIREIVSHHVKLFKAKVVEAEDQGKGPKAELAELLAIELPAKADGEAEGAGI